MSYACYTNPIYLVPEPPLYVTSRVHQIQPPPNKIVYNNFYVALGVHLHHLHPLATPMHDDDYAKIRSVTLKHGQRAVHAWWMLRWSLVYPYSLNDSKPCQQLHVNETLHRLSVFRVEEQQWEIKTVNVKCLYLSGISWYRDDTLSESADWTECRPAARWSDSMRF